jgi:putative endonuclease
VGSPIVIPALSRDPWVRKQVGVSDLTPCVYILACGHYGTLYTGVTSNLVGRIIQHRQGTFEGFTTKYRVTRLVWFDTTDTMDNAIAAEKRIKRWRRDWKIALIEESNPNWDDLFLSLVS